VGKRVPVSNDPPVMERPFQLGVNGKGKGERRIKTQGLAARVWADTLLRVMRGET
jgi:hypothetical protein